MKLMCDRDIRVYKRLNLVRWDIVRADIPQKKRGQLNVKCHKAVCTDCWDTMGFV